MKTYLFSIGFLAVCLFTSCQHNPNSEDVSVVLAQAGSNEEVSSKEAEPTYTLMDREISFLMDIWPGEYDNVEQLDFDKYSGKPGIEEGGHMRVHNFTQKIDLPKFGNNVLYVEEYINDNPSQIHRQCLYVLQPDNEEKGIRVQIFHFKDVTPYLSVENDLNLLSEMDPESKNFNMGCEMMIRREGMTFKGKTIDKQCNKGESNTEQTYDYQIVVGEGSYSFKTILYSASSDKRLPDAQQHEPYLLEKARCFSCMIDFPREEGGRPVNTVHYIKIHDQGGKFNFEYTDGRQMVLGMRNTWSFGMKRETFVIFIQEGTQDGPTLIYSWGAPGADRIGFNPGWIRVQCDLNTPENIAMQHALRPDS